MQTDFGRYKVRLYTFFPPSLLRLIFANAKCLAKKEIGLFLTPLPIFLIVDAFEIGIIMNNSQVVRQHTAFQDLKINLLSLCINKDQVRVMFLFSCFSNIVFNTQQVVIKHLCAMLSANSRDYNDE